MDELTVVERRLAKLQRVENGVSGGVGAVLAVAFVTWMAIEGIVHPYALLIPFVAGTVISKFGFAVAEARLARRRDAIVRPALPAAAVVERNEPAEPGPTIAPVFSDAPEPAPPPGETPQFLK